MKNPTIAACLSVWILFSALLASAPDALGKTGKDASACGVVVKDVRIVPETVKNDARRRVAVTATVFTAEEKTAITRVSSDWTHTQIFGGFDLEPVRGRLADAYDEGVWRGMVELPPRMDPGVYSIPVVAADGAGNRGSALASFTVEWARNPDTPAVGSRAFAVGLYQISGEQVNDGNRVKLLADGAEALEARLELIRSAKKQINLQSYTFDDAIAGGELLDELLKKARQGVEVNVILNADSQVPTSPLSTLKLKINEALSSLSKTVTESLKDMGRESPLAETLSRKTRFEGVNLLVVSGGDLDGLVPAGEGEKKRNDHWLSRALLRALSDYDKLSAARELKAYFQGPGGLPALPLLNYALHEKLLIVDGERAIVGGRNLEDRYFTHWIDMDLLLEGPVVNQAQASFLENFRELAEGEDRDKIPEALQKATPLAGGVPAVFAKNTPWERDYRCLDALVFAVTACRKRLYASSQYLSLPDSLLTDAILDAARRGVDVRILTNSRETSRETALGGGYLVTTGNLRPFLEAGVRVFEIEGEPVETAPQPYCHAKEFMFDGKALAVGSFNLSLRSCYVESENLVFVLDQDITRERETAFLNLIQNQAREITLKELEKRIQENKTAVQAASAMNLLF